MGNTMTPNTHMIHGMGKWGKTLCGRDPEPGWTETDKKPTCTHCLKKLRKK